MNLTGNDSLEIVNYKTQTLYEFGINVSLVCVE